VADIGVVYLYRFAEGAAPVRTFLDCYRTHPAGLEHDLHVILKGFPDRQALAAARALFGSLSVNTIEVDDTGYDVSSYIAAAQSISNPKLLFLNTFSKILADDWLAHFDSALRMPGVGLVGATGSWQSGSTGYEAALFRALRRLKALRDLTNRFHRSAPQAGDLAANNGTPDRINVRQVLRNLPRMGLYPLRLYEFGRHPNPHIRTNAFMIRRDVFLSLRSMTFKRKIDAYKFESGRHSMTKQIIARGLRPVVVDRSGKTYNISEWKSSSTFWIDLQANLLVADNQTGSYTTGSSERRKALKNHAWDGPSSWDMRGPI
jgi:hypothetical protein